MGLSGSHHHAKSAWRTASLPFFQDCLCELLQAVPDVQRIELALPSSVLDSVLAWNANSSLHRPSTAKFCRNFMFAMLNPKPYVDPLKSRSPANPQA